MIGAAFALTLLVMSPVATRPAVVVVGDRNVQPVRAATLVDRPLLFVNRSGSRVDVHFLGSPGEHVVESVNGSIAAVVLRPGRHPFVVRFADDRRHVHGVVETRDVPPVPEGLPICEGVTAARICIAQ